MCRGWLRSKDGAGYLSMPGRPLNLDNRSMLIVLVVNVGWVV